LKHLSDIINDYEKRRHDQANRHARDHEEIVEENNELNRMVAYYEYEYPLLYNIVAEKDKKIQALEQEVERLKAEK
jgi:uncharacterized small protein (DUF1192 family)